MTKAEDAADTIVADTMRAPPDADATAAATATARATGDEAPLIAGRYRILGLIGAGAMGTVYRARDSELEEVVALKVLRRELAAAPGLLDRFRQEVRLARKVTHPHVARVFDIGEHEGERFLTMELVDGESLADVIEREGAMPLPRVATIVRAIAAGLEAAHRAAIVHRDLKPENVLVAKDGRVVITDFGIARALAGSAMRTTGGGFVGTPAYMAPEQVEAGKDVDARADVYALGEIAFELATGAHPWPGNEPLAVAFARLMKPPPDPAMHRPDMPRAFADAILAAMARERDARTGTATQLADALDRAVAQMSATAHPGAHPSAHPGAHPGTHPSTPPTSLRALGELSLAVLPFTAASDPADAQLANGMSAELVDALSMTARLRVRPHLQLQDAAPRDPVAIGKDLGVGAVVTGSLGRTAEGLRVSARVISVSQGFQLWARRFECQTRDLLAVTDEIAHAIAAALSTEVPVAMRRPATDGEAIALYLRARAVMRAGWHTPDVFAPAIAFIDEARTRAPHDPTILAGWAVVRARKAFLRPVGTDATRDIELARDAAERAVRDSPHIGEAWVALATVRWLSHDTPGVVRALRGALDASPSLARAHDMLGRVLLEHGAVESAIERLELALSLDPSTIDPRWELARAHALMGRWKECDAVFALPHEGPDARVPHAVFGSRYAMWRGVRDASWEPTTESSLTGEPLLMFRLLAGVVRHGVVDDHVLRDMDSTAATRVARVELMMQQMRVEAHLATGDLPRAFASLERAVALGLVDILWIDRLPLADRLRADPRWSTLRARVAEAVAPTLAVARDVGLLRARVSPVSA